jgi:hypothetical protein
MLREISVSIEEVRVRRVLWVLGVLFSAFLAPAAVLALLIGTEGAVRGYTESRGFLGTAAPHISTIVYLQRQNPELTFIPASVIGGVASAATEVIVGAILCIGAKGALRIISGSSKE